MVLSIPKVKNFALPNQGKNHLWEKMSWRILTQGGGRKSPYLTKIKVLYSSTGIYFLIKCEDKKINSTFRNDFQPLYQEDVVEIFLQPNEKFPIYIEYEISPKCHELPLLIINNYGKFKELITFFCKEYPPSS